MDESHNLRNKHGKNAKLLESGRFRKTSPLKPLSFKNTELGFNHQGSIDFKTVNIHRTVGIYFLIFTCNRLAIK